MSGESVLSPTQDTEEKGHLMPAASQPLALSLIFQGLRRSLACLLIISNVSGPLSPPPYHRRAPILQ